MSAAVRVKLPDGSEKTLEAGATGIDLARSIGEGLLRAAVGLLVDGRLLDLRTPLRDGWTVRVVTRRDREGLEVLRHSAAHCMAQAVLRLHPGARLGVGPTIEDGFYYDIALERPLTPEDLQRIEAEMRRIVKEDLAIERFELPRDEALRLVEKAGQPFKVELIEQIPADEAISFYRQGEFTDLCSGPHLLRTSQLGKAFEIEKVAGAYWRGDEENEQMQRLYGTAWFSRADLDGYRRRLEEARRRDHRRIGRELDLFSFHECAPAMPFFHPKGALVRNLLVDYVRSLYRERGYDEVVTPQILDVQLWVRSGHYDNYRENMYFTRLEREGGDASESAPDEPDSAIKPMNCPTHCLIFGARKRSYRELPLRLADFGRLHRYERSGVTQGLLRVRSFSQDDAHIFCSEEQIEAEVRGVTEMILECYRTFGFDEVRIYLSTRPVKAIGEPALWEKAETALAGALDFLAVDYRVQPGEGAFYGPKIDFVVTDALRREWQLGTCQLDFNLPERFDLRYTGSDDREHRPVMIHRAMLGSLERFLGVLLEHTAGDLPLFLAPEQVRVISITDRQAERAAEVASRLRREGFRATADTRSEKMAAKVRDASLAKVRYQLIIGARELERGTVAVRHRTDGDLGEFELSAFRDRLEREVRAFD